MIICIVGPTGVGKTKLSIELAKKYHFNILNADATQVYKGLDIGSAKIKDKCGIKHYLLDIKNPLEEYSVKDFQEDGRNILNSEKDLIIVGGTGLYINALLYDYEFSKIENKNNFEKYSNEELYNMALNKDANMNININNRVRLINFLNNNNPSSKRKNKLYDFLCIGLTSNRETIYKNADKRVEKMFEEGLLDEVRVLYQKYPESMILKRAIGYKEVIEYLNKNLSLEDTKNLIKKNTRHYIKRQYTWFNHQLDVKWFNTDFDNFSNTINEVIEYIEKNRRL